MCVCAGTFVRVVHAAVEVNVAVWIVVLANRKGLYSQEESLNRKK